MHADQARYNIKLQNASLVEDETSVSGGFEARLVAWLAILVAVLSIIVTWSLASKEQRDGAVGYMTGFWHSEIDHKPTDPNKGQVEQKVTPTPSPTPQPSGTIAGVWNGVFHYSDGRSAVPFTFNFGTVGCRGRGEEPNTFGDQTSTRLYSNLECTINTLSPGETIFIRKTYDGTGGQSHTVVYQGTVSSDLHQISGQWVLGSARGNFAMQR